jgi:hypothetical protein
MAAPINFSKLKGAENVTETRQRPLGLGIVSSIYKKNLELWTLLNIQQTSEKSEASTYLQTFPRYFRTVGYSSCHFHILLLSLISLHLCPVLHSF